VFDVKAHGGCSAPRPPASEHRVQALPHVGQIEKPSIQVSPLTEHQSVSVGARQAPGSLDRDDLFDLLQREA
jgi:hypothetical protein